MTPLSGKRVLLVEDDPIIAMTVEDMLLDAGADVVGPIAWLMEAIQVAQRVVFDAAVLDVNINGGRSYPVADELQRRGVPFLFATGYGTEGLEAYRARVPVLQKPYTPQQLERTLRRVLGYE